MEPAVLPQPRKSSSLYAIAIDLAAADQTTLPPTLGRAIHAQVMNWLSLGDSQLANAIHNSQEIPFSVSGLIGSRRKAGNKPGDKFCIRIALLDGELIHPLLNGLEKWGTEPISLSKCPFVIREIHAMPGSHPEVSSSDYYLLFKTSKVSDDITLEFLSPTSFKQKQYVQPFPLPEFVFGSLLRRWNAFAPEAVQFPSVMWQGLVSSYELKTHALKMEGGAEIGSVGWVRYRFPNREQARIATTLAHFSAFAGVGRKTAMGMGQTQLIS
jgi:CRISPR-associated endoribonuclease Cas6